MDEKINWSGKKPRDLEVYFSTDTQKGLSRENYARAAEKYGENNIAPDILSDRDFHGLEKRALDWRAVLSRSAGIFGICYVLSAIIMDLLGFDVKLFLPIAYILLMASAFLLFLLSEHNYYSLYKKSRPRSLVIRAGARKKVLAEYLVPGDLIVLAKGDVVPADAKIIASHGLSCSHRLQTEDGEYYIRPHKAPSTRAALVPGVEPDILYASDIIESGSCTAVVFATGGDTMVARKYAQQPAEQPEPAQQSGIQANAARVSKTLSALSAALAAPAILLGIIMQRDMALVILTCLTASASAFPEQLTILADFALTTGMKRSALFGAAVKKAADVDKLNRADMLIAGKGELCPDDSLRLERVYFTDKELEINGGSKRELEYILLNAAAVCDYHSPAAARAILGAATKLGVNYWEYQRLGEVASKGGVTSAPVLAKQKIMLACVGEADNIIARCTYQLAGGLYEPVNTPALEHRLTALYERHDLVMAVALREITNISGDLDVTPEGLDFWVFAGFSEQGSPETREDIAALKNFGVTPVMVTEASSGVYAYKAALKSGIIAEHDDYSRMLVRADNIAGADAGRIRVVERLSAQNNISLLRLLRAQGRYPAVTAGGMSGPEILGEDYLALWGAGMKGGALKNKSGVTLKNMSLKLVLKALRNAGLINANAVNLMIFTAGLFAAQYLLIFFAVLTNGAYILSPAQIIWSSAGAGFFCAAAIGSSARDLGKIKKRKAKPIRKHGMLTGLYIFLAVALTFFICFALEGNNILEYIGAHEVSRQAQTAAFLAFIVACFANSARYIRNFLTNKIFMASAGLHIMLVGLALAVEPVREYLGFGELDLRSACVVAAVGLIQAIAFSFVRE